MNSKNETNRYDDGNIPEIDLPRNAGITHAQNSSGKNSTNSHMQSSSAGNAGITHAQDRVVTPAEPLPESTRPRKDGPGGA